LLKKIAIGNYELQIISKLKFNPKVYVNVYVNIVIEFKSKNTEFHTYKSKQERSFKIVLKHIHATMNVDDIRKGIENQEQTIMEHHMEHMEHQEARY